MAGIDGVKALMAGLDAEGRDLEAIVEARPGAWAVMFRDGQVCGLEYEPAAERLVITAGLDRGAEEHRLAVYEAMLTFNRLARETGGLRMGLAGPDREIEISAEVAAPGLTLEGLRRALGQVADTARAWEGFIADPGSGTPPRIQGIRG